jgi:hypothetical protein
MLHSYTHLAIIHCIANTQLHIIMTDLECNKWAEPSMQTIPNSNYSNAPFLCIKLQFH